MNRWLAALIAIGGGAIGAIAGTVTVVVSLYALLWLFVFGDDSWPSGVMSALDAAIPLLGLILWVLIGWSIWKGLRPRPA